jgi:hypothetical protein
MHERFPLELRATVGATQGGRRSIGQKWSGPFIT